MNWKNILLGVVLGTSLVAGAIGGAYIAKDVRQNISQSSAGQQAPNTPDIPDKPVGKEIVDYEFYGDTITAYKGSDSVVTLPTSYSLGEVTPQEISCEDYFAVMENVDKYYVEETYSVTLTDSLGKEVVITCKDDLMNLDPHFGGEEVEHVELTYPVTFTAYIQHFVEGDDIKLTKVGHAFDYSIDFVTKVIVPEGFTELNGSFSGCSSIVDIDLPSTLETIKGQVFSSTGITEISLPQGLKTIDGPAFSSTKISNITLPDTIITMSQVFQNCRYLEEINLENLSVTSIGYGCFYGCERLINVKLPSTLETIGSSAFRGCKALSEISLPDSVKEIYDYAFADCTSLKTLKLSEGLNEIYWNSFDSSAITSLILPKGLKNFRDDSFFNMKSLRKVYIPNFSNFESDFTTQSQFGYSKLFAGCTDNLITVYFESPNMPSWCTKDNLKTYHSYAKIVYGATLEQFNAA